MGLEQHPSGKKTATGPFLHSGTSLILSLMVVAWNLLIILLFVASC